MICGLWLVMKNGADAAKIDLCPGYGQWRVQPLAEQEVIIGMHSYIVADDESVDESEVLNEKACKGKISKRAKRSKTDDSAWLDSLGFIVYNFETEKMPPKERRPRGRPRKHHI